VVEYDLRALYSYCPTKENLFTTTKIGTTPISTLFYRLRSVDCDCEQHKQRII